MRLPMQSQPVQRNIPSQPVADRRSCGAADGGRGVQPSDVVLRHPIDQVAWLKAIKPPILTPIPIYPMPMPFL